MKFWDRANRCSFLAAYRDAGGFDSLPTHVRQSEYIITKRYKYRKAMGIEIYEPVGESSKKLRYLYNLGFSAEAIGSACGLAQGTIYKIMAKHSPRVGKANAKTIRELKISDIFANAHDINMVPMFATRRRLSALRRMGWTLAYIQSQMTVKCELRNMMNRNSRISAEVHRDIARVYSELEHKRGPSRLTAGRAAKLLLPPPASWDDIEDPKCRPSGVTNETLI